MKDLVYATILQAVLRVITLLSQRVFHDSVPVVPGGDAEEREERHSERAEVRVLPEALARMVLVAACEKSVRSWWSEPHLAI